MTSQILSNYFPIEQLNDILLGIALVVTILAAILVLGLAVIALAGDTPCSKLLRTSCKQVPTQAKVAHLVRGMLWGGWLK